MECPGRELANIEVVYGADRWKGEELHVQKLRGWTPDKLSVRAATLQFNSYFKQILDSLDYHGINNLKGMAMDSHEAGAQNWTDDFLAAFKRLRGYDLTPYLPVMAGYVIDDIKTSENVLYDVRLTIADLIAERYYGTFDRLCRKHNVVFTAQATGNAQCIVAISIVAKSKVQKPQGEILRGESVLKELFTGTYV